MTLHRNWTAAGGTLAAVFVAALAAGCGDVNAALAQLADARDRSADLTVQFTRAASASDRAVMADTDEASVAFAHDAEQATQAAQRDVEALGPILQGLHYAPESQLLEQFATRFKDYRALDRAILDLAVENSNLKAQRLSFGPAQQAVDALRDALDAVAPAAPADAWHVKALAADAVAEIREVQVLQAPHIADPDDAVMTRMEQHMTASEAAARQTLASLAPLVDARSRPRLAAAARSLDAFVDVNAQIVALSRRNTNVRSLALSLNEKRPLVAACEDSLRALHDALAGRGYTIGRWK